MGSTAGDGVFLYSPHRLIATTDCWAEGVDDGANAPNHKECLVEPVDAEGLREVAVRLLAKIYAEAILPRVGRQGTLDGQTPSLES